MIINKRINSYLLILLTLMSLFCNYHSTFAATTPTIIYTVDTPQLVRGRAFDVSIKLADFLTSDEISSVAIKLKYDSSKLEPYGAPYVQISELFAAGTSEFGNFPSKINEDTNSRYIYIYYYNPAAITGMTEYDFATVTFRVLDDAAYGSVLMKDYEQEHSEITAYAEGMFPAYTLQFNEASISILTINDITPVILDESGTTILTNGDTFFAPHKPKIPKLPNVSYSVSVTNLISGQLTTYTLAEYDVLPQFEDGKYLFSVTATNDALPTDIATTDVTIIIDTFNGTLKMDITNFRAETPPGVPYTIGATFTPPQPLIAGISSFSFDFLYDKDIYTYVDFTDNYDVGGISVENNATAGKLTVTFSSPASDDAYNLKVLTDLVLFTFNIRDDIPTENYTNGRLATTFTINNVVMPRYASAINPNPGFYTSVGAEATVSILEPDIEPPVTVVIDEAIMWTITDKTIIVNVTDRLSGVANVFAKPGILDADSYDTVTSEVALDNDGDNNYSFTTNVADGESIRSYTIRAVDALGNTSYEVVKVLVDKKSPIADISSATFTPTAAVRGPIVVTIPVSDGSEFDNSGITATSFRWKQGIFEDVTAFENDSISLTDVEPFNGFTTTITAPSNGFYTLLVTDTVGNKEIYSVEVNQIYALTVETLRGNATALASSHNAVLATDDPIFTKVDNKTNGRFKQISFDWDETEGFTTIAELSSDGGGTFTPYFKITMINTPGDYIVRISTTKNDNELVTDFKEYRFSIVPPDDIPTVNDDTVWTLTDVNMFRYAIDNNLNKAEYFPGGYFSANVTGDFLYTDNNAIDFALILKRHKESLAPEEVFDIYK